MPGHTVDRSRTGASRSSTRGHEIAHHSYAHVDPAQQSRDDERRHGAGARRLERIGVRPLGFRSPSADLSASTLELIEEHGFLYDSSLMADDFRPFHPRIGDRVTQQSRSSAASESRLWELPMCFEFDDWVHFQFNFDPYRKGGAPPSDVLEIWRGDFDWMHEHVDGGVLTVACIRR